MTVTTKQNLGAKSTSGSGKPHLVLHWFRNDLRVHDNPALVHSSKNSDVCLPVFCFDSGLYGDAARSPFGSLKWGPKRAKFLLESVSDLRGQLEAIGSELLVAHGPLDAEFDRLVKTFHQDYQISVVCQEEPLKEERDALQQVQAALKKYQPQSRVTTVWGSTMYELSDLPFSADLANMPDVFTPFRVQVEKACKIPRPLPAPRNKLVPLPRDSPHRPTVTAALSIMPDLRELGYTDEQMAEAACSDPRGVMDFLGGETQALARVKEYIWDLDLLKEYFDTRNGMLGPNYSSKFSPWLSVGCLSARHVAHQCAKYEEQVVKNKSTYWLVFELLWRDFCKFFCVKNGDKVFYPGGTIGRSKKWSTFDRNFAAWKEGRTGYPLVDANMRELQATGWMSNRGRQNVCSFLAIDMNHDWRYGASLLLLLGQTRANVMLYCMRARWRATVISDAHISPSHCLQLTLAGADWFESQLLDYDVYSNWFVRLGWFPPFVGEVPPHSWCASTETHSLFFFSLFPQCHQMPCPLAHHTELVFGCWNDRWPFESFQHCQTKQRLRSIGCVCETLDPRIA